MLPFSSPFLSAAVQQVSTFSPFVLSHLAHPKMKSSCANPFFHQHRIRIQIGMGQNKKRKEKEKEKKGKLMV
jgi:hypothetical protein